MHEFLHSRVVGELGMGAIKKSSSAEKVRRRRRRKKEEGWTLLIGEGEIQRTRIFCQEEGWRARRRHFNGPFVSPLIFLAFYSISSKEFKHEWMNECMKNCVFREKNKPFRGPRKNLAAFSALLISLKP